MLRAVGVAEARGASAAVVASAGAGLGVVFGLIVTMLLVHERAQRDAALGVHESVDVENAEVLRT